MSVYLCIGILYHVVPVPLLPNLQSAVPHWWVEIRDDSIDTMKSANMEIMSSPGPHLCVSLYLSCAVR